VETASEAVDPYREESEEGVALAEPAPPGAPARVTSPVGAPAPAPAPALAPPPRAVRRRAEVRGRVRVRALAADARRELLWISVVYLSARALLILAAVLFDAYGHHSLQSELAHWDGLWYRDVANNGYPRHVYHTQTNLGFFPLFPITIFLVSPILQLLTSHNQIWASTFAGVLISGTGGLIATIFVHKLAEGWWDRASARRATVLFVVFPGSVVFSMVYTEGLLLPLAAVCIWALERRRWVLAGVMAGLGTAVQPVGLVLSVVCAVCALRELWQHGPRSRDFRMSVLSTAMSGVGVLSFMGFLWAWTGSPMANFTAQHDGWQEKTTAFALVDLVKRQIPRFDPYHFNHPTINLNDVFGFIGALIMIYALWLLFRSRREVSLPAVVWTLGIMFFAFTSKYVPPNPRMVITAFPMLMLIGRWVQGKWYGFVIGVNVVALAGLSLLTFYGHVLRP
jgi:Gpi18-like mannosyltransferase